MGLHRRIPPSSRSRVSAIIALLKQLRRHRFHPYVSSFIVIAVTCCCHLLLSGAIIVIVVLVVHILGSEKVSTQGERHKAWHRPGQSTLGVLLMRVCVVQDLFWDCETPCLSKGRSGDVRCSAVWANGWAAAGSTCTFLTGSKRKIGTEEGGTKQAKAH